MCRRIFFTIVTVILVLLGVVAAGLAVLYFNITRPEPTGTSGPAAVVEAAPTPAETRKAEETAERIVREYRQPPPDVPRSEPEAFQVSITEEEANQLLRSLPEVRKSLAQTEINSLRMEFEPERLVVRARVPLWGETQARASATLRAWAENGGIAYETEAVHIGDFPAPERLRKELDTQLAAQFRLLEKRFKGRIEKLEIGENELTVSGTRR